MPRHDLHVPAGAEIVLEGTSIRARRRVEGPFGDHTGYYNEQERFPVFTVERITMRRDPDLSHRPTPASRPTSRRCSGVALNEVFVPLLQKQFPEIVDFYLPPEGCSYRIAVREHEEAVSRARQARDVRHLVVPAPVHVHQVHHRHATTT